MDLEPPLCGRSRPPGYRKVLIMNRSEARLPAPARSLSSRIDSPKTEMWREPASAPRFATSLLGSHGGQEHRAGVAVATTGEASDSWYDVFA